MLYGRSSMFGNQILLTASTLLSRGLKFILLIFLARSLHPAGLAPYSFAINLIGILILFADLGIVQIFTKYAAQSADQSSLFSKILKMKIILSLAFAFLVGIALFLIPSAVRLVTILMAVQFLALSLRDIPYGLFRAHGNFIIESLSLIGESIFVFTMALIVFHFSVSLLAFVTLFAGVSLVTSGVVYYIACKRVVVSLRGAWVFDVFLFREGLQFVAFSMMAALCINSGTIAAGYLGSAQTGIYDAANKLFMLLVLIPTTFSLVLFPRLAAQHEHSDRRYILLMLCGGALSGSILMGIARPLILLTFGSAFRASIPLLQILGLAAPFVFLTYFLAMAFIARRGIDWNFLFALGLTGSVVAVGTLVGFFMHALSILAYAMVGSFAFFVLCMVLINKKEKYLYVS